MRPPLTGCCILSCLAMGLLAAVSTARADWIWVEGEKPSKQTMNRHPWWYDQVKREHFSGGDFISNFHESKEGQAEYVFQSARAGEYEFWVRANPVLARLSYKLGDGPWTEIQLGQNQQGSVNVAADAKPDLRFIAWIKAGKAPLRKGPNTIAFRMSGDKQNHGYLDCFVLSSEPFQPRGLLKPDQQDEYDRQLAAAHKGWFPFLPKAEKPGTECAIDLRWLNEQTAGESGFVGVQGDRFVRGASGRPVRFWAVNGPPHELKDPEALARLARTLARYGVNMVRIHGGVFRENGEPDLEQVRWRQQVVAAMKREGIYSHLSIYFPLWMRPKPGTAWLEGYDGNKHPFAALYFNKDFQEKYRGWWKALLLTPDERTGRRLIDEPAVAAVEMINEDSYFFWTFTADNIPDPQLRILEKQFGEWLANRYGSLDEARKQWNHQKEARDNPAEGRMAFRHLWAMFNQRTPRDQDTARFLFESQRAFYQDTYQFLRGLGFKGLITASNWTTASAEVFGPVEKMSYTCGDFIDRHGYFGSNHKGDNAAWSIRDGHTYSDRSALRFDAEEPGKPKQFVHPAVDPCYGGKPSMISETTFCRPNRYRSEAPLFYSVFAALQDTDAVVHFALDGPAWTVKPNFFMQPWTLMSPAMMGQFPAAAMIYRRGLVAPGEVLAEVNLPVDDLLALKGTPLAQDAAFDELRLKDVPQGLAIKPGNVIDPLIHFAGRTSVNFVAGPRAHRLVDLKPYVDRAKQTVTSSTGQLRLDYGKGLLLIDAPAAQGASGALKAAGECRLSDLTIRSDMELGHVVAVSLEAGPLATSGRILLQVMSEEKNGSFAVEPTSPGSYRITSIGQDPWMVRELSGTVRLHRADAARLKATPLDHGGCRAGSAVHAGEIRLQPSVTYYLIEREGPAGAGR